jgi:hypothetical protein
MAGNIQPVSFVNPFDPAGSAALAVQQQAIQRQQALAQALQQQSLQDSGTARGRTSWTQGAAKLAEALAAKSIYKKTQDQQVDLSTKQGQIIGRMFGIGGQSPTDNVSNVPGDDNRGAYGSGGVEDNGNLPQATPPQSGPPAQPRPSPQPTAPQSYPMSLSGDPVKDYSDYTMNPEEFTKQLIASHAPVDMAKMVAQAQQAMARGDIATAQALLGSINKQNYISPINVRQGGIALDPVTHEVIFQSAQAPTGSAVDYQGGQPVGMHTIAGSDNALRNSKAGDLVDVWDSASHQMIKVPASTVLNAGAPGGGQPGGSSQPYAAGPPTGFTPAANELGQQSAKAFHDVAEAGSDAQNRIYGLNQMSGIIDQGLKTGPGSARLTNFLGHWNTIAPQFAQINPAGISSRQELDKWGAQVSSRYASELGLSGSDKRVELSIHATPNGEMTPQALRQIIPQMIGFENAKIGRAQAASVYSQQHPEGFSQFSALWNKTYNPQIYTHMSQGPQAFGAWAKSLPADQRAKIRDQYIALKQMGAIPQ